MKLFTILLLFVSVYLSATENNDNYYYVSSTPRVKCLPFNTSEGRQCKTIDEYALNITNELEGRDNVTMIFLQGMHNLTRNLYMEEKLNVTIRGNTSKENRPFILLFQGNATFQNITELKLCKLSIVGFSRSAVSIRNTFNVIIEDVVINGSALLFQCIGCNSINILDIHFVGSVLAIAWPKYDLNIDSHAYRSVLIRDTVFLLSSKGNGLSCCNVYSLEIINILVSDLPSNCTTKPPASSLITFCQYFPWGMLHLEVCDLLVSNLHEMKINNSTFKRTAGTGLCIKIPSNAMVWIRNSTIIDHMKGGAMFTYYGIDGIRVLLDNTNISNNVNTLSGLLTASALSVYTIYIVDAPAHKIPRLYMINTHFKGNRHLVNKPITTVSITSHIIAKVRDCNFTDNYGSAITAYTTKEDHVLISFLGVIIFRNNIAHRGGAIHLFKARIEINYGVNIIFEGNFAKDVGGAIYVHSTQWLSSYYDTDAGNYGDCFYLIANCHYVRIGTALTFEKNSAQNGGEDIFGAALLSTCNVCPSRRLATSVVHHLFSLPQLGDHTFSPISSHPSRVCLCDRNSLLYTPRYFCTNVSQIFLSRSVYPGEEFSFEAVLVGAEFGTGTGSVYSQFLTQSDSVLYPPHQYSQRIDDFRKCKQLNYTVFSSNSLEILVLTSSDETIIKYGDQETIERESFRYVRNLMIDTAPPGLLTTPVYINLTMLPCPQGFQHTGSPPKCDCVPALVANGMFCNFTNGVGYVYRNGTKWVGILSYNVSNERSFIIQKKCPFDYCVAYLTGVDFSYPNTQCAMNHAGILCGGCRKGFSLALGTNMCLSCSGSRNLGLLLFFLLAGILLVVFIKVLNMTVSQGTINGLVFYANIVWAYQNVFFPKNISNTWFSLMRVFIAWLNLDFGIETCFVEGLTGYAKIWLQFAFPLYIWGIAGAMVILAHYSRIMTKLFGNNCVQVLATLFLLSYAKLFRTIITAMVPAVIEVYPQSSDRRSGSIVVWAFDGNLSYCGNPHGFLFVVALLTLVFLWLPYTTILLVFRVLMKRSSFKCLRWVIRIVPLVETYFGPLKIAHYYWVGVLLLVRGIVLIILTLTYTTTPTACLLSLVIILSLCLVFLSYSGRMYRNTFLSFLERSFLLNLQVLGISVLFIDLEFSDASKEVVVNISVSITFIQFVGIIFFHVYKLIKKTVKKRGCCLIKNKTSNTQEKFEEDNSYSLMEDQQVMIYQDKCDLISMQYLEDYAVNADLHRKK